MPAAVWTRSATNSSRTASRILRFTPTRMWNRPSGLHSGCCSTRVPFAKSALLMAFAQSSSGEEKQRTRLRVISTLYWPWSSSCIRAVFFASCSSRLALALASDMREPLFSRLDAADHERVTVLPASQTAGAESISSKMSAMANRTGVPGMVKASSSIGRAPPLAASIVHASRVFASMIQMCSTPIVR